MKHTCHASVTQELWSFREEGAPLDARSAVCSAFKYGGGPDGVLILYGIQGKDYFKAFSSCLDDLWRGTYCIMGYVWQRHTAIYRRILRGRYKVETLWAGLPYGENGPVFDFIVGRKLGIDGTILGPHALWDKEGGNGR
jgi:hypothetical protein